MTDPFLKSWSNKSDNEKTISPQNQKNKIVKKVKKWKKIWLTQFLIWCVFFWLIFLIWISIWLFYLASNPQILAEWWNIESAKQTLKLLWAIFFGIIILIGFALSIGNFIKLIFSKTWRWKFLIWTIISVIFLFLGLVGGLAFYSKIKNLPSDIKYQNVSIVYPEVVWKDNFISFNKLWNFIFAPTYIRFSLNLQKLPQNVIKVDFNCWNWTQQYSINILPTQRNQTLLPIWICYYPQKWTFKPKYTFHYVRWWEETTKTFYMPNLVIKSQITIKINWKTNYNLPLNAFGDTINWWNAPVKLTVDAGDLLVNYASIFKNWIVNWDFNGDGKWDIKNKEKAYYIYQNKWTYEIFVNFPEANNLTFKIWQIRINESDLPQCSIDYKKLKSWKLIFSIDLENVDFNYSIKKALITSEIWEVAWKTRIISKNKIIWFLNNPGKYILKLTMKLWNWKTITCTKNFEYETEISKLPIIIYLSSSEEKPYKKFKKVYISKDENINIDLPYKTNYLKLVIPTISDNINNINIFSENWNIINQPQKWTFITKIEKQEKFNIKINYKNWTTDNFEITFTPKPPKIISILKIDPTHWYSPLKVSLDASQTKLLDKDDEILYFTWDFWDGSPIFKNVSQWIVRHTYKYDYENQNWIFYPKVIITTKKWYTAIATWKVIVQQPPKKIKIISISHPTQVAKVWDSVTFRIETDWQIKNIYWDFWNWKKFSCEWRGCMTAHTTYDQPWTYRVNVTVEFYDYPSETASLKIKVIE